MLVGGGVLGWARNHQLIPYNQDLDLFINGSFWRSPDMMMFLESIKEKYGFNVVWYPKNLRSFSIDFSKINLNGIGLWSYNFKNGKVVAAHHRNTWDYDIINPPRLVNFNGIKTYVPNKPIEYVEKYYGKWRQEMQCKKLQSNRKCLS